MGNRACILIKQNVKDNGVYLYTHWKANDTKEIIKTSLKKYWRWNDAPYLTRIIFDVMTYNNHNEETGYGISDKQIGNSILYTLICDDKIIIDNDSISYTFEEFIK